MDLHEQNKKTLNEAFQENGKVWNRDTSDAELSDYIRILSTGFISNSDQYQWIIRGLTINHIQMARLIERLNAQNKRVTRWFMILAIASLAASVVQIGLAIFCK